MSVLIGMNSSPKIICIEEERNIEKKDDKKLISEYAKKTKDLIAKKVINDYEDVVRRYKNKEVYESRVAYRTYKNNPEYQNQSLILTLHMLKAKKRFHLKLTMEMAFIRGNVARGEDELLLNPTRLFDYTKRKVYEVDNYEDIVRISEGCKPSDDDWLSGYKYLREYIDDLIPDDNLISWIRYKVCGECMTPYKTFVEDIKNSKLCHRCDMNDLMYKITETKLHNCCVCMEEIYNIGKITVCGDVRHTIHKKCFDQMVGSRCPICRREEEESIV